MYGFDRLFVFMSDGYNAMTGLRVYKLLIIILMLLNPVIVMSEGHYVYA